MIMYGFINVASHITSDIACYAAVVSVASNDTNAC